MLLAHEFQAKLASNVKGNARNKPADFETALARPLDLPWVWEVALIDLSFPNNWVNLDKPIYFAILSDSTESINDMLLDNFESKKYQDLNRSIISPQGLARMWVWRMSRLSPGNFTAQTISDLIVLTLKETVKDIKDPKIDVLEQTQRVRFY